jgi:hypothetical protein
MNEAPFRERMTCNDEQVVFTALVAEGLGIETRNFDFAHIANVIGIPRERVKDAVNALCAHEVLVQAGTGGGRPNQNGFRLGL